MLATETGGSRDLSRLRPRGADRPWTAPDTARYQRAQRWEQETGKGGRGKKGKGKGKDKP